MAPAKKLTIIRLPPMGTILEVLMALMLLIGDLGRYYPERRSGQQLFFAFAEIEAVWMSKK